MLNLHLDWLSTFLELLGYLILDIWSFMFHHFDWKLPIQGQILGILGVNMGQISIFHFITPKGTSLHDSASFEPLRVKIRPGVSSLRWSEKKK